MPLPDFLTRFARTIGAYAGDEALMQAGVSAAANVIVADGEVAGDEFDTALTGVLADPILAKGYDPDGTVRGGHVLEANVWPTLEVFLIESATPLVEHKNPESTLELYDFGS